MADDMIRVGAPHVQSLGEQHGRASSPISLLFDGEDVLVSM
jgi:hypothetical protein